MADESILADDATTQTTDTATETTQATETAQVVDTAQTEAPKETDWRSELAGEDKELLGFFGRYHSKDAGLKAIKKIHDDIRNGKYIKPLGEDATDEEKAAWNKLQGVPEKPEGYLDAIAKTGLVVGEDDKPALERVFAKAHEVGAPPAAVNALVESYYELVDEQEAQLSEADNQAKTEGEDLLRTEWGADFRRNMNVLKTHLDTLPESVSNAILTGRDGDGVRLANNPELLKWITSLALDANPLATVVPGTGAGAASAIADEIAALEKRMGTDRVAWFKDERAQARYQELITARDRMAAR